MNELSNGRLIDRRLADLEADMSRVQDRIEQVPVLVERMNAQNKALEELSENVKSLRNTLITFAFTVAGSAIAILVGLTQLVGQ